MTVTKVLYVEPGLDSKSTAAILENSTSLLNLQCCFTVVPNAFIGLECTEHTNFDIIFVQYNLENFGAVDMLRVLRVAGVLTPVILLTAVDEGATDENVLTLGFDGVLRKPFSPRALCNLISAVLETDNFYSNASVNAPAFSNPIRVTLPPSVLPGDQEAANHRRELRNSRLPMPAKEISEVEWDPDAEIRKLLAQHSSQMELSVQTNHKSYGNTELNYNLSEQFLKGNIRESATV